MTQEMRANEIREVVKFLNALVEAAGRDEMIVEYSVTDRDTKREIINPVIDVLVAKEI